MTRILGLDPAGSFGWAYLENNTYLDGGVNKFKYPTKVQQEKKGIPKGKKWLDALEWLEVIIPEKNPDFVIMEDVRRHVSTLAGHSYGYLRYVTEAVCAKNSVPFYPIVVTEWKKAALGYGGGSKATVEKVIPALYPDVEFLTDDQMDATAIALAGHLYNQDDKLNSLLLRAGGKKKKNETKSKGN